MHNTSAAESAKMMLKQKQFSKKINYDALNNLFPGAKVVGGGSGKSKGHKAGSGRNTRKRGRQQESSDESSEEEDDSDAATNGRGGRPRGKDAAVGRKSAKVGLQSTGHGYFESNNNDSHVEIVEEDGEMLPPSHPLRRKETSLNKRNQASSAAEESQVTDLGEDVDEWAEEEALEVNADMADMRRKLGYFDNDTMDDDEE